MAHGAIRHDLGISKVERFQFGKVCYKVLHFLGKN